MTGTVYAEMGDHKSARAMLKRLFDTAGKNFDPSLFASIIHAALGEIEAAFELIERQLSAGSTLFISALSPAGPPVRRPTLHVMPAKRRPAAAARFAPLVVV
jgi:hypothetical protein